MLSHVDVNDIVQFYGTGKKGVVTRVINEHTGDYLSVFVQDDMIHVFCSPGDVKRIGHVEMTYRDGDYCVISL